MRGERERGGGVSKGYQCNKDGRRPDSVGEYEKISVHDCNREKEVQKKKNSDIVGTLTTTQLCRSGQITLY